MPSKNTCIECRHCVKRDDPRKGERHYCSRKKRGLPAVGSRRAACDKFELPAAVAHWGP